MVMHAVHVLIQTQANNEDSLWLDLQALFFSVAEHCPSHVDS